MGLNNQITTKFQRKFCIKKTTEGRKKTRWYGNVGNWRSQEHQMKRCKRSVTVMGRNVSRGGILIEEAPHHQLVGQKTQLTV